MCVWSLELFEGNEIALLGLFLEIHGSNFIHYIDKVGNMAPAYSVSFVIGI